MGYAKREMMAYEEAEEFLKKFADLEIPKAAEEISKGLGDIEAANHVVSGTLISWFNEKLKRGEY